MAVGRPVRSSQDQSRSDSSDLKELNFNGTITDPTVPAIQMNEDEPDQDENVVSKKNPKLKKKKNSRNSKKEFKKEFVSCHNFRVTFLYFNE